MSAFETEVWPLVRNIQGGCDRAEAEWWIDELLHRIPNRVHNPVGKLIVEIGALDGGGTIVLAWAAKELGARVLSVDLHGTEDPPPGVEHRAWWCARRRGWYGLRVWAENITKSGLKPWISGMIDDSLAAAAVVSLKERVIFLHVDGLHEAPRPREDFLAWRDSLCVGGTVAFHDCTDEAVNGCVDGLIQDGGLQGFKEIDLPPLREVSPHSSWNVGWRTRAFTRLA